jgi:hypothetical protein
MGAESLKELTIQEVLNLKDFTKVYVEYKNNRYATGWEFKKNEYTQNKWGTVNKVSEECKYSVDE